METNDLAARKSTKKIHLSVCKILVLISFGFCLNLLSAGIGRIDVEAATLKFVGSNSITVAETDATLVLRLTQTGVGGCTISGGLSFSGTATPGPDYIAPAATEFSIIGGDEQTFEIEFVDDLLGEGDETIIVDALIEGAVGCGGQDISSIARKTITITDDDEIRPPEARDDRNIETKIDQPVTIDVLQNDIQFGVPVTILEVLPPENGEAILNPNSTITYIPNEGFVGSDSFEYTITDGVNTSSASVFITVGPGISDTIDGGAGGAGGGSEDAQEPVPLPEAIDRSCIDGASENLQQRCRELSQLSADDLTNALVDISARQIPAQGTHLVEFGATQIRNIERRLISLRRGQTDLLEMQGLSLRIGDETLPGTILAAATAQSQPETTDSNTTVSADPQTNQDKDEVLINDERSKIGAFIGGLVETGDKDGTEKEAGFDFTTNGITIGADYRLSPDQVIGAALGFIKTDSDFVNDSGTNESDGLTASLYGSFHVPESFFLDWIVSAGAVDFNTNRNIRYPDFQTQTDGSTQGDFFGIGMTGGMERNIGGGWIFSPYGRLELLKLEIDGYVENGGDGLGLMIDQQKIDSLKLSIAAEISKAFKTRRGAIVPGFYIEWENQLADSEREILARFAENPVVPFAISTDPTDSNYFNIGASVTSVFRDWFAGYVNIESRVGQDDVKKTSFNLGARMTF